MPSISKLWPIGGSATIYSGAGLTDPTNVAADDGAYASADASGGPGERYGNWGLGASIPASATIDSVAVEYQFKWTAASGVRTVAVRGRVGGALLSEHRDGSGATTDTVATATLTGDRAWTRADLLDGTFEVVLTASLGHGAAGTINVDYLKVTVGYTVPASQELLVGKIASAESIRGIFFGQVNAGFISSSEVVRGVQLSQGGVIPQTIFVGKIKEGLSGELGLNWTTPALGYANGLVISQARLSVVPGASEGAAVYTRTTLAINCGARVVLAAPISAGGHVRVALVSDTAGSAGYVLAISASGVVTLSEIGGALILDADIGPPSVGDEFGLSKIGNFFKFFHRPTGGDWTEPAAATGGTYEGPMYVGLAMSQGAMLDDLYVDGLP